MPALERSVEITGRIAAFRRPNSAFVPGDSSKAERSPGSESHNSTQAEVSASACSKNPDVAPPGFPEVKAPAPRRRSAADRNAFTSSSGTQNAPQVRKAPAAREEAGSDDNAASGMRT